MISGRFWVFVSFFLLNPPVKAGEISSDTSLGSGVFTQEIGYSSSGNGDLSPWAYDLFYSYSVSEVGATKKNSRGSGQYDHTHTFDFGLGYEGENSQGGSLSYSTTPEELLSILGAGMYFGHRYFFKSEDEHFAPSLKLTLSGDLSRYTQRFSKALAAGRKQRPSAGSDGILQSSVGLSGSLRLFEWLGIKLYGTRFFYDKDVGQFLNQLDQARAISTRLENFSSTLNGFSKEEIGVGLDLTLPSDFELEIGSTLAHAEASGVSTAGYSVKITRSWGMFETGMSDTFTNSASNSQNLFGLSASYRF